MQCKVTGCSHPKEGRSHYCLSHKKNKARHGHAEQASVSSHELATYLKTVRARIAKNINSPVWDNQFEKAWKFVKSGQHFELSITRRSKLPRKSIQRLLGIRRELSQRTALRSCFT